MSSAQPKSRPTSLSRLQIPQTQIPQAPPRSAPAPAPSSKGTSQSNLGGQPSAAINGGADKLKALFEKELAKLRAAHLAEVQQLAAEAAGIKAVGTHALQVAGQRSFEAQRELEELRAEHERLLSSLQEVGLDHAGNGVLRFSPATAQIVEDFVGGARIQEERMRETAGVATQELDTVLYGQVGPAQFFAVLSRVLEKGRLYADAIAQQHQPQQAEQYQEQQHHQQEYQQVDEQQRQQQSPESSSGAFMQSDLEIFDETTTSASAYPSSKRPSPASEGLDPLNTKRQKTTV